MAATAAGLALVGTVGLGTASAAGADSDIDPDEPVLLKGRTTASYFWDDGSGRAGDTGLPASGKPMQKGLAASPSWPLLTEGYVIYKGKKAPFFVGDRGPGAPSSRGIMLDLDAKTFAELTGGRFDSDSLMVRGNGGMGHIEVQYVITKWGPGKGKKNHPVPFSTGAWSEYDDDPAKPIRTAADIKAAKAAAKAKTRAAKAKARAAKARAKSAKEKAEAAKEKAEERAEAAEEKASSGRAPDRSAAKDRAARSDDRAASDDSRKADEPTATATDMETAGEETDPAALVAFALLVLGLTAGYTHRWYRSRRARESTDE